MSSRILSMCSENAKSSVCWVKVFRCWASIKCSWCQVNPQWVSSSVQVPSNTVCAEHQYFNNVKLLHYLKSQRFSRSKTTSLLPWILWISWKIRMLSWWYKILGEPFLGEYRWIPHDVSRINKMERKIMIFYLINSNPNMSEK